MNGTDGAPGMNGTDGAPGMNGTDGAPGPLVPIGNLTDVEITDVTNSHFLHFENDTWVNRPLTGLVPIVTVFSVVPMVMVPCLCLGPTPATALSATCPPGLSVTGGSCDQLGMIPDLVLVTHGTTLALPTTWTCAWSYLGIPAPMVASPPVTLTATVFCV